MWKSRTRSKLWYIMLPGDVLIFNLAIVATFWTRYFGHIPERNFAAYISTCIPVTLLAVVIMDFYGLYRTEGKLWSEIFASLFVSVIFIGPLTVVVSYMTTNYAFPRTVLLLSMAAEMIFLTIWRVLMLKIERKIAANPPVLLIAGEIDFDFMQSLLEDKGVIIAAAFRVMNDAEMLAGVKAFIENNDAPFYIMSGELADSVKDLLAREAYKRNRRLLVLPSFYELMLAQSHFMQIGDTPFFEVWRETNATTSRAKRLTDILIASIGLVVLSPVMLITAAVILLAAGKPVIYRQTRVSEKGRSFTLYKFRTMVNDAEHGTGPVLSCEDDLRLIACGDFLRSARIDELPQLYNVLKGDMSIVGPRPERPFFVEQYENDIPEYCYRHNMKAGVTGLAQVTGRYSTSVEDKLRYDLLYAKNKSFLFDLQIIFQTIKIILVRSKSK